MQHDHFDLQDVLSSKAAAAASTALASKATNANSVTQTMQTAAHAYLVAVQVLTSATKRW